MATKNIVPRSSGEGTLGSSSKLWKEVYHITSSFGDISLIEDASNRLQLLGGPFVAASGLSGSLTHLSNGSSYLVEGSNISITTGSSGQVTIASPLSGIIEDLSTLGAPSTDGQIIVATGAGAFAYESGATARTSLGLGTGDSPTFTGLTLSGDLTVNGTTTTVNTDNILVEDPVVLLGSGASSANSNGGLALLSGSSVSGQSLVIGRVANDTWGVGRKDVTGGTVTTLADMTLVDFKAAGITASSLTLGSTAVTSTATELNLLDGGTAVGSSISVADSDGFIVNDAGTMKTIPASDLKSYTSAGISSAADDITIGDAAITISTTSGNTLINSANAGTTTISGSNVALTSENNVTVQGNLRPSAADTYSLGTASAEWKDLYLGDDANIHFGNDQDVNFTHNPDSGVTLLMNPTTGSPTFELKTTNSDMYVGPKLKFNHDSSTPAANDAVGYINFYGNSSTGVSRLYSGIRSQIVSTTNSNERGSLKLGVNANGNISYGAITIEGTSTSGIATVDLPDHNGSTGGLKLGGTLVTSTAAEINILDGATVTTTELNLLDGGTSVGSSITLADSDGIIVNDNGTMKSIPASDLKTYAGGFEYNRVTSGTSSTASVGNHYSFDFTQIAASYTLNLPNVSASNSGREIRIIIKTHHAGSSLTIQPDSGDTLLDVDSGGSINNLTLDVNTASLVGTSFLLVSDGTDQWEIL